MTRFLVHWLSIAVALAVAAWLVPSIWIASPAALVFGSLAIGLVNALVRPILALVTLPVTILTLGLFYLVVNAAAFGLAAWFVRGFAVHSFWGALFGALIVSIVSSVVHNQIERGLKA